MRTIIPIVILCWLSLHQAVGQASACEVVQIEYSPQIAALYSPDSSQYLLNLQDTAGVFQIYVGNTGDTSLTCISTDYTDGNCCGLLRHWKDRNKLQVKWHPTENLIICVVEKEYYNELLYTPYNIRLGWLQSGLWMDIWAVQPDGSQWYPLAATDKGVTGPVFTPDGNRCAWAEALDSSDLTVDVFGRWDLQQSDFVFDNGVPAFANTVSIQPPGARWIEPGNYAPDGVSLLISSDIGMTNAEGQDQYILNTETGSVINLTNSPMIWDEHGVFSPDGNKIVFMSSYPYRADTNSYHTFSIKTEFMLMNADGSELQQLTHFLEPGYPESSDGIAATAHWNDAGDKLFAQSLIFPDYENWIITFAGNCGNANLTPTAEPFKPDWRMYPNPTQDMLYLETDFSGELDIKITDALGQIVRRFASIGNEIEIPIGDLTNGTYFLSVQTTDGYWVQSFIKND